MDKIGAPRPAKHTSISSPPRPGVLGQRLQLAQATGLEVVQVGPNRPDVVCDIEKTPDLCRRRKAGRPSLGPNCFMHISSPVGRNGPQVPPLTGTGSALRVGPAPDGVKLQRKGTDYD
jgi:hypothetical protein